MGKKSGNGKAAAPAVALKEQKKKEKPSKKGKEPVYESEDDEEVEDVVEYGDEEEEEEDEDYEAADDDEDEDEEEEGEEEDGEEEEEGEEEGIERDDDYEDLDEEEEEQIPTEEEPGGINNIVGLQQATREMKLRLPGMGEDEEAPWYETLVLTNPLPFEVDPQDDLKRELCFYKHAAQAVEQAEQRFKVLGIPYKRPDDYFAEMLKSDVHMAKVRKNLLEHKQRIQSVEDRKRQQELKRFGKQVQIQKEQDRAKQKKADLDGIKKWRKDRKQNGAEDDFDVLLEDEQKLREYAKRAADSSKSPKQEPRKSMKRKRKDDKYGFGGPKKRQKVNDSESAADTRGFSKFKNSAIDRDLAPMVNKGGRHKKGGAPNRPGKARRQQQRARK